MAAVHDTASSSLFAAPAGCGTNCTTQVLPFHRSARFTLAPEGAAKLPAAVQAVAAVHETAEKALPWEPTGTGTVCVVQLPFQPMASGKLFPMRSAKTPTAVHAFVAEQDTPNSALFTWPAGTGVDWLVHLLPSHRSASGVEVFWVVVVVPTAVQAEAEVHETAKNPLSWPAGLGAVSTFHFV